MKHQHEGAETKPELLEGLSVLLLGKSLSKTRFFFKRNTSGNEGFVEGKHSLAQI